MLLRRLLEKLRFKLNTFIKPEMIPFKKKGVITFRSRVSNLSHFSSIENIILEENVFVGHFNYLDGYKTLRIGKGSQVTNYVSILTHSSHNALRMYGEKYIDMISDERAIESAPTSIGTYCYIGPHTVIMPGSKLGKGCIVSAYSYVSGEFPDFSIIRGLPAKVVGDTRKIDKALLEQFPDLNKTHFSNDVH